MLLLPIRIGSSRKCRRCELQINDQKAACPHCHHLSEDEAMQLKALLKQESKVVHSGLRKWFIVIFILSVLLVLVTFI
ncbi:hypothetical protein D5018_11020 [Parashewanella curva]|uniref:Uncharacterized protein n=1 Tax=Parashewanella curva TaxID=2338552 RepID=A0A3L8PW51_9GAMM|nr:hypothetical protein D5018_11020 [Parashewanella curva]